MVLIGTDSHRQPEAARLLALTAGEPYFYVILGRRVEHPLQREGDASNALSLSTTQGRLRAMNADIRGLCVGPGEGDELLAAGGELLIAADQTAGRIAVIHSTAPAGDSVPLHVHHQSDECFYILAGHYHLTCGPDTFDAGPGSFVYLPRGVPHAYQLGDEPGRKLIVAVPAGLEKFFQDMESDNIDLDELQHRHAITFL